MLNVIIPLFFKYKQYIIYSVVLLSIASLSLFIRYQSNKIDNLQLKNEQLKEYKVKYIKLNESFVALKNKTDEKKKEAVIINETVDKIRQSNDTKTITVIKTEYNASCKEADDVFNEFIKK